MGIRVGVGLGVGANTVTSVVRGGSRLETADVELAVTLVGSVVTVILRVVSKLLSGSRCGVKADAVASLHHLH